MSVYLLERSDGTVAIMRLVEGTTPEAEVAKWPEGERSKIASIHEITEEDVPKDRTFREAWSRKNPAKPVDVDMEKARNMWRDKIREARDPVLKTLDVEYIRALETGDEVKKAEVVARKHALRDLPQDPRIEASSTPEELKTVWHPELSPGELTTSVPQVPKEKEDKK